jgi:hypothetical protein
MEMEIRSDKIYSYLDQLIEKHGVWKGLRLGESRMTHLTFHLLPSTPGHLVNEYLAYELDEFEAELRVKGFLRRYQAIGAYRLKDNILTVYLVKRIGNIKLM